MPDKLSEPELMSAPPDKPAYRPFPALAQAIRAESERIVEQWRVRTVAAMPELADLSVQQFRDDIVRILAAMADALASNDPPDLRKLVMAAPDHGFQRFMQEYDLADLLAEERILRRVIVERVEIGLARQCKQDEAAALHSMIDIMLQQGVLALVQKQKEELRESAESQLKYLSFLSHDIGNNFGVISINLEFVLKRLARMPEMKETADFVSAAMETMQRTRDGMRRLLEHEQLRKSNAAPRTALVEIRELVEPIVKLARGEAAQKNVGIEIEIFPGCIAETNADLVAIILQNLIGNAVKHAIGRADSIGTVRIIATRADVPAATRQSGPQSKKLQTHWIIRVADDGPGIPPDKIKDLFAAFKSTPQHGKSLLDEEGGFGLGLAIAGQAARLLGTTIEVETQVGSGSTFSFRVPAPEGLR